jgi:hypothetical protein
MFRKIALENELLYSTVFAVLKIISTGFAMVIIKLQNIFGKTAHV